VRAAIELVPHSFGCIVQRGEVALLYDRGCVPHYTIEMIELDEPPWDRMLATPMVTSSARDAGRG